MSRKWRKFYRKGVRLCQKMVRLYHNSKEMTENADIYCKGCVWEECAYEDK